jgi:hypothetical protein
MANRHKPTHRIPCLTRKAKTNKIYGRSGISPLLSGIDPVLRFLAEKRNITAFKRNRSGFLCSPYGGRDALIRIPLPRVYGGAKAQGENHA